MFRSLLGRRISQQLVSKPNLTGTQLVRFISTDTTPSDEVTVIRHTGADKGIVTIAFNRPKAKNALSRSLVSSFRKTLEDIRFDTETRVVVLRSAVPGVFCAGADLKERATMTPAEVQQFLHSMKTSFKELEDLPQPTIAALDGAALGGGFELSLCCDLRIAGPRAVLGLPETSLAIIPGAGGTLRLTKLIGTSQTKALVFTARRLGPYPALSMGVVNDIVESAECMDEQSTADHDLGYQRAMEWAREILPNGPIAVRMAKKSINHANSVDPATGLDVEQLCYAQVIPTEDRLEGLRAFKEKRKPVYKGYRVNSLAMESTPLVSSGDLANSARAIDDAVNALRYEHQHGFGFRADTETRDENSESYEEHQHDEDDEDMGMTREIMGLEDTENITVSRVNFDQWMHDHAVLENEQGHVQDREEEEEQGYDDEYDEEGDMDYEGNDSTPNIRDAWLKARGQWGSHEDSVTGSVTSSNQCEEEEEGYEDHATGPAGECYSDETDTYSGAQYDTLTQSIQTGLHGFEQAVNHSNETDPPLNPAENLALEVGHNLVHMPLSASDEESVANAMRFLAEIAGQTAADNGESNAATDTQATNALKDEAAIKPSDIPEAKSLNTYERPPLPPENASQSLKDVHKAISESLARLITIADEISNGCDEVDQAVSEQPLGATDPSYSGDDHEKQSDNDGAVKALEEDSQESIELAQRTLSAFEKFHAEAASERDKLNTKIVMLNTEIFQLDAEKSALNRRVKELEEESTELSQTIDDLQSNIKEMQDKETEVIEELRTRVRTAASRASSLSDDFESVQQKLEETKQVLVIVNCERTELINKCNRLETDLESFASRLKSEQLAHEETNEALHIARDGNANEARRAELQSLATKLEQKCMELAKRLSRSQDQERQLLNSNRALEARLSSALKQLDEPRCPEDILADHRREWDAQLVESRKQAKAAHEKLAAAEENLDEERRMNAILRRRIEEMETAHAKSADQAAKKRKRDAGSVVDESAFVDNLEATSLDSVVESLPPSTEANDMSGESNQIHAALPQIPKSRSTMTNIELRSYINDQANHNSNYCKEALVSAGEFARGRRRKTLNAQSSIATPGIRSQDYGYRLADHIEKPVTPRVNLAGNNSRSAGGPPINASGSSSTRKPHVPPATNRLSFSISSTRRSEVLRDLSMARRQKEALAARSASSQRTSASTPLPSSNAPSLVSGIQRGGRSLEYRIL
ncbi:hypothetical protein GGI12_002584 [Dipsacomyces acuminosporus]|nr:hypothetical protein GGI12_002584 [Dipsacomyces acuminosporus]